MSWDLTIFTVELRLKIADVFMGLVDEEQFNLEIYPALVVLWHDDGPNFENLVIVKLALVSNTCHLQPIEMFWFNQLATTESKASSLRYLRLIEGLIGISFIGRVGEVLGDDMFLTTEWE